MSAAAQRDLSISLNKLGHVLVAAGDLSAARARFEQSLAIRERLAAENPTSVSAQRDLGVSLDRLADMLEAAGSHSEARARLEEALAISKRLAAANPTSASAQRDLIISHTKLGLLSGDQAHWNEALRIALELQSKGLLAPRDALMLDYLRQHARGGR